MKAFARRLLARAARALLAPVNEQWQARHKQLISRFDRLEKRVEAALDRGHAESRLLAARLDARRGARLGARIPRQRADLPAVAGSPARGGPCPPDVVALAACSACGHAEWTTVCEYNRFLLLESAPDELAQRADYALCHRCGVVFARSRPVGPRYRFLVERFEETIGRIVDEGGSAMGSRQLTPASAGDLRSRAAHGVFVSEYPRRRRQHLPALLRDRLAIAAHVEVIGSLLSLVTPRILELRPRFGALGAALRRLYGGETMALPLFEAQQLLVREVYGTRAEFLLDYDQLTIPYEGRFDLVVANHLLTHAVHPADALAVIRQKLAPGGHLYLYNEPDEADLLDSGKSMFSTLNAFHLQTFDTDSLGRVLASAGFEPVFVGHHQGNCIALARAEAQPVAWEPLSERVRGRRVAKYAVARDRGILMLPERLRGVFASEWEAVVERGFARKLVDFDADGRLRLVKSAGTP